MLTGFNCIAAVTSGIVILDIGLLLSVLSLLGFVFGTAYSIIQIKVQIERDIEIIRRQIKQLRIDSTYAARDLEEELEDVQNYLTSPERLKFPFAIRSSNSGMKASEYLSYAVRGEVDEGN